MDSLDWHLRCIRNTLLPDPIFLKFLRLRRRLDRRLRRIAVASPAQELRIGRLAPVFDPVGI